MIKTHFLKKKIVINRNISETFDFFSKAENLNLITPPELGFKIITKLPVEMKEGLLLEYKIKLNGIFFNWLTEITKWEPPYYFEDTQIKGPYKVWVHKHIFEDYSGRTKMTDEINYKSPGGIFEFIPHNLIVRKKVKYIFDYREKLINEILK